jgi:hypothetical protein
MTISKKYQWRIEIEEFLPSFKIDNRFENRIVGENHQPRFVSMTLELTESELDEFMATINTGFECRLISVTNMSEVMVFALRQTSDVIKLNLLDGSRRQLWTPLQVFTSILKSDNDVRRMNANFDRDEPFRAWIDQSDWNQLLEHEAADRLKYTFAE